MRGHFILSIAAACLLLYPVTGAASHSDIKQAVWKDVSSGIRDFKLQRVAVRPDNPDTVYVSSPDSVYRTDDGGDTWKEVLSLGGTGNTINALDTAAEETVFAGTREGLYRSDDRGTHWGIIFRETGSLETSVLSIAVHPMNPELIFVGTASGVYRTENNGRDWDRGRNMPAGSPVTSIAVDNSEPDTLYAAAGNGLYKSINRGNDWQRTFGIPDAGEESDIPVEDTETDSDEIKTGSGITAVIIDASDNRKIYLGTSSGLLITEDSGLSWTRAGGSGLISRNIRHLAMSSGDTDSIYAATKKGVFQYSRASDNWHELYNGMVSPDVRFLAFSHELQRSSILWAATGRGIFRTVPRTHPNYDGINIGAQHVLSGFDYEPTIEEIRKAAIEYAEVQPDKIEKWRKAAAKKALLPDLRFEYQKNRNWQKSTYFYSTSSEKYKDDDITSDRDREWSISLNWELGELIWNNDQTSIDSRSKLMVELRDNVLNEVTRLYFERRKTQVEMLFSPPGDIKGKVDREIRLQELTADIDALTGSYLSGKLAQQK
ncbi:MAG: hypothetical protein C4526_01760 [Nitrospiraceae bacterium]|nr:MAG: hypothetical protein C4526_01760 [Nitrospiraceae bacterium]